ncbi:MAG: hypothetical protein WC627_12130 [Legionella sp.]|jgi:hypothetical protein
MPVTNDNRMIALLIYDLVAFKNQMRSESQLDDLEKKLHAALDKHGDESEEYKQLKKEEKHYFTNFRKINEDAEKSIKKILNIDAIDEVATLSGDHQVLFAQILEQLNDFMGFRGDFSPEDKERSAFNKNCIEKCNRLIEQIINITNQNPQFKFDDETNIKIKKLAGDNEEVSAKAAFGAISGDLLNLTTAALDKRIENKLNSWKQTINAPPWAASYKDLLKFVDRATRNDISLGIINKELQSYKKKYLQGAEVKIEDVTTISQINSVLNQIEQAHTDMYQAEQNALKAREATSMLAINVTINKALEVADEFSQVCTDKKNINLVKRDMLRKEFSALILACMDEGSEETFICPDNKKEVIDFNVVNERMRLKTTTEDDNSKPIPIPNSETLQNREQLIKNLSEVEKIKIAIKAVTQVFALLDSKEEVSDKDLWDVLQKMRDINASREKCEQSNLLYLNYLNNKKAIDNVAKALTTVGILFMGSQYVDSASTLLTGAITYSKNYFTTLPTLISVSLVAGLKETSKHLVDYYEAKALGYAKNTVISHVSNQSFFKPPPPEPTEADLKERIAQNIDKNINTPFDNKPH